MPERPMALPSKDVTGLIAEVGRVGDDEWVQDVLEDRNLAGLGPAPGPSPD